MKITIDEVAKRAGVSKTTVSRIINGHYEHVTEATKQKVLKIIEELDYRPNALARGLKQMKTNVIGIVLSNLQNPFWARVLEGVEDTCRSLGYNLMICNSNEDLKLEEEHIKAFRMRQVDGIIVNATAKNKRLFQSLVESNYPLVAINRKIEGIPVDTVVMDNVKGAAMAVEHLLRSGRKSVALFVYPPDGVSPRLERMEGYKQALSARGIDYDSSLIQVIDEKKGEAKQAVKNFLLASPTVDAIFSTNNMMTLEILEGIKELGLTVPDDVALIGYDETVWSKHLDPPLTTVNQPAYEMGELAAKRLIKLIESKRKPKPKTVLLEPNLIIRRSCGAEEQGASNDG